MNFKIVQTKTVACWDVKLFNQKNHEKIATKVTHRANTFIFIFIVLRMLILVVIFILLCFESRVCKSLSCPFKQSSRATGLFVVRNQPEKC